MPGSPTGGDSHINGLLTDVSVAFVQSAENFVAPNVFPPVPVTKQSNKVRTYGIADFARDEMEIRLPGTESAGGGYRISTVTYSCDTYALHKDVAWDDAANDDLGKMDEDAATWLAGKALIKQEVDFASSFMATGIWTTDRTGGTDFVVWSDLSSSPLEYIETQCGVIEARTGMWPTDLTLNRTGWSALKNHPDIVDRIKGAAGPGNPAMVTREAVAALMEIKRINVSKAIKNTAQEGLAASMSYIVGNHALLSYAPDSPGLYTPSAGYTFRWNQYSASIDGQSISTIPVPLKKSDRHEIEANWDQKVISADLGVFLSGVV